MGSITINGRSYSGNNINIVNGTVVVDGKIISHSSDSSEQIIIEKIEGPIAKLLCGESVRIIGDVGGDVHAKGSVNCNNIKGHLSSTGSVNCDRVSGNVATGGSANCDDVGGNVSAGGSLVCDKVVGKVV